MCVGCGGTCTPPRFTQPAGDPAMRIIGTNMAPTVQPGHLVRQVADTLTYQTLYTGLTPNGQQATYIHPGTFAPNFRAGRGR